MDFAKDSYIYESSIIPTPDLTNKTHLNYYSEARGSRVATPVYGDDAAVTGKLISETELELTFDTLVSEGVIQHYEIDIVGENQSMNRKSFQAKLFSGKIL